MIEFDPAKDAANIAKHGVSLAMASDLDLDAAVVVSDQRRDYGEPRYLAFWLVDDQPYCLAFTFREGGVRAISLRRAHIKEYLRHVEG